MTSPASASSRLLRRLAAVEAPAVNTLSSGSGPAPIVWSEARGSIVVDADGHRYRDLTSGFGVSALGHRHPRIVAAVEEQSNRLLHGLGDVAAHPRRIELAAELAARVPLPDPRVYFAVSGADSVEIALKTALLATGRAGILCFDGAYHGLTMGALATTESRFRGPFAPHLSEHVRRLAYGCGAGELESALADGAVGAVIVEPILGRGGVVPPPPGWLAELTRLCHDSGALLVADEILTGCGRTGAFFVAGEEGFEPDLLCCGKALGGGMPIAATVGTREVMDHWPAEGPALHTSTFLAHPPACAAALAVLRLFDEEPVLARVRALGDRVRAALEGRFGGRAGVREIRGRGALWGVELDRPRAASAWAAAARQRGVLTLVAGGDDEVLELLPAYTVEHDLLDAALARLDEALDEVLS